MQTICLSTPPRIHSSSCLDILKTFTDLGRPVPSGQYIIDPNVAGPTDITVAACDMETYGGGWTRIFHAVTDDYHDGAHRCSESLHERVLLQFHRSGQIVAPSLT